MSEYFNISYDKADEAFASTIAAKADAVWRSIITRSGADVSQIGKIALIICPDAAHYIAATDKSVDEYEDWMVGNSNFEKSVFASCLPVRQKCTLPPSLKRFLCMNPSICFLIRLCRIIPRRYGAPRALRFTMPIK